MRILGAISTTWRVLPDGTKITDTPQGGTVITPANDKSKRLAEEIYSKRESPVSKNGSKIYS